MNPDEQTPRPAVAGQYGSHSNLFQIGLVSFAARLVMHLLWLGGGGDDDTSLNF